MHQSWNELSISQRELEQVYEPSLICNWAIALATGLILCQPQSWQPIFKLEISCLFISLIFNYPLVLIVGRNWELVNNNIQGLVIILAIASGFFKEIPDKIWRWTPLRKQYCQKL